MSVARMCFITPLFSSGKNTLLYRCLVGSFSCPLILSCPGDQTGECRAHGNLGSAFFSKGNYREALTNHRNQLVLAMKLKDREVRSNCGGI